METVHEQHNLHVLLALPRHHVKLQHGLDRQRDLLVASIEYCFISGSRRHCRRHSMHHTVCNAALEPSGCDKLSMHGLTCAACSPLCDEPTLLKQAIGKCIFYDAQSHPVLDAASWVQELSLGKNLLQKDGKSIQQETDSASTHAFVSHACSGQLLTCNSIPQNMCNLQAHTDKYIAIILSTCSLSGTALRGSFYLTSGCF